MLGSAWDVKSAAISSASEVTIDMGALRAYFDTNGDGKLTSADAAFAQFMVLVTNADGSTTVKTLAQLGITEINLTDDSTPLELLDGSVIEGQTTCKKSDGSTGTVASTMLVAEGRSCRADSGELCGGEPQPMAALAGAAEARQATGERGRGRIRFDAGRFEHKGFLCGASWSGA